MNVRQIREEVLAIGQPVTYGDTEIPLLWFIAYLDGEDTDGARFVRDLIEVEAINAA